jgi:hypothetical protein
MKQETRNKLRNVVTQCRKLLEESISQELEGKYGIFARNDEVTADANAPMTHLSEEEQAARKDILDHLAHIKARAFKPKDALDQLVREISFTHLNRLCAYKMMEAREIYINGQKFREAVSRGFKSNGFLHYLGMDGHEADERLYSTGKQDVAYRHFLDWLGGLLSDEIGVLFSPSDPANRLYPKQKTLDEVLGLLNGGGIKPEETQLREEWPTVWSQDETIGWVYQYFTPKELRDAARDPQKGGSQAPRNSYELAFRNQFFTPRYVVEFLTDNTLGRTWYEMRNGNTKLKDQCRYMVRRPTEVFLKEGEQPPEDSAEGRDDLSQEELLKLAVHVPHRPKKDPRELKVLDPACGSGHFLLYCFDLLITIYEEAYSDPELGPALQAETAYPTLDALRRDVPRLILAHNLHGIDIDLRCSQIAALALWLRCQRAYQAKGLMKDHPKITRSNIVCAEAMPGEEAMLKDFIPQLQPRLLGQLVEVVFDKMKLAGEAGSLLEIEEEIRDAVALARKEWLAGPISIQQGLFGENNPVPQQQRFDLSGVTDAQFFEQAEEKVVAALRIYAEKAQNGQRLQRRLFAEDTVRGFGFVDLCQKRYDVVLMNPPFGLAPADAFAYLRGAFPHSYTELLATFVDRGATLCNGFLGAVTSRAFMVATRLKVWRSELAAQRIRLMADLGEGIMDAAFVEAAAYVLDCQTVPSLPALLTLDARASLSKPTALREMAALSDSSSTYLTPIAAFLALPNTKILYSLTPSILGLLQSPNRFEPSVGTARQGITTFGDFRFIRLRWEVNASLIGVNNVWEHLCKGGPYARYYGDIHLLVKWDKTGDEIRALNIAANGSDAQARQASEYWRRPGATYSIRSQKGFSARALPKGCLFTGQGPAILSESSLSNAAMLGWLNSELITTLIELQSNDGKFMSGIIKHLPWKDISSDDLALIETATERAVSAIRRVYCCNETNSFFSGMPLAGSIAAVASRLNEVAAEAKSCTAKCDSEINEIVYKHYSVARSQVMRLRQQLAFVDSEQENAESSEDDDGDDANVTATEAAKRILSVCAGAVFCRWSHTFALTSDCDVSKASVFDLLVATSPAEMTATTTGGGGLRPDDPEHAEDLVRRIRDVLEEVWNVRANGIEREACELLNVKELREYLRKTGAGGFWDDHLKRYSKSRRKAPVYWLLQSTKRNYALWLYYHKLDNDLLFKALVNYVEPKIRLENSRLGTLRAQKAAAGESGKEAKRLAKDLERQEDFLSELQDFEDKLRRAANLHLEPDLNDGVVLNIATLYELVPWKEAKNYWDELLGGKYAWSSIGKQLRQKGLVK